MRVVVVTPPQPVVTLAQAKMAIREDAADDDALISTYIAAATRGLDGPSGWLGRALGAQTLKAFAQDDDWSAYRHHRWRHVIELPYPPTRSQDLMTVSAVTYEDGDATVTVDPSTYSLDGSSRVLRFERPAFAFGCSELAVEYTTGTPVPVVGDPPAPTGAPPPIADEVVVAIQMLAAAFYANREADVIDARAVVAENPAVMRCLETLWIRR